MPERTRIFISYSHRDGGTLASRLAADLSTRGYAVWLDQQRLKGGSSWSQEIEQALDASEVVLTLLSSGAYQSEVCRGEQLRSLRHQKCVIPMLVQANSDAPVYLEAREYRDFSDPAFYASRLEDLLADIEARSGSNLAVAYQETRYETVPPLPTNFVARPAELESLRQTLLTDCRDRKIELVALRGMPGVGKTVLAQALCYDEAVQAVFPDGIVWVKLGKSPSESDLIREMREAAKALGAIAHGFETLSESSKRLRGILRDKRALLVMDDAWQAEHVYLFQPQHAKFFRLLFTTRSAEAIAAIGAREQVLGTLPEYQARRLLANFSSRREEELPAAAVGILRECRGLALALAMIGAVLRTKSDDRWADLLESLTRSNLEEVRLKLPNYKYASFGAAMEASILDLPVKTQRQYRDLAVFPDNTAILEGALEVMWGVESKQVRRITAQLADRSLAALDTQTRLSLHDLQIDYLRERAGDLILLHNRLIERYRMRNPNGWHAASDDGYLVQNLVHHLRLAGMKSEIRKLLSQQNPDGRPAWYKTKLAAGDETGYRTDIAMAWDYEGETVVGDPAFPQSVGLQVRYATILASFNSMASIALASPLWEAAIIRWPKRAARWLPYVHRIPEDYLRAEALIKVAPHLKAELLIEVLMAGNIERASSA